VVGIGSRGHALERSCLRELSAEEPTAVLAASITVEDEPGPGTPGFVALSKGFNDKVGAKVVVEGPADNSETKGFTLDESWLRDRGNDTGETPECARRPRPVARSRGPGNNQQAPQRPISCSMRSSVPHGLPGRRRGNPGAGPRRTEGAQPCSVQT
jgi:hypothetical protein